VINYAYGEMKILYTRGDPMNPNTICLSLPKNL